MTALPTFELAGYAGRSANGFVDAVLAKKALVLDVRFSPYSRIPPWRAQSLEKRLPGHYARYGHFWGNRNDKGGEIEIPDFQGGLDVLPSLLAAPADPFASIVLLCQCGVEEGCHRSRIGELLKVRGHTVVSFDWDAAECGCAAVSALSADEAASLLRRRMAEHGGRVPALPTLAPAFLSLREGRLLHGFNVVLDRILCDDRARIELLIEAYAAATQAPEPDVERATICFHRQPAAEAIRIYFGAEWRPSNEHGPSPQGEPVSA